MIGLRCLSFRQRFGKCFMQRLAVLYLLCTELLPELVSYKYTV